MPPETPLVFLGGSQHGLYELLAHRGGLEKLKDRAALEAWCLAHPQGLAVSEVEASPLPTTKILVVSMKSWSKVLGKADSP